VLDPQILIMNKHKEIARNTIFHDNYFSFFWMLVYSLVLSKQNFSHLDLLSVNSVQILTQLVPVRRACLGHSVDQVNTATWKANIRSKDVI